MLKIKSPIIDPTTGNKIGSLDLFKKVYATTCLQRFYRNLIKWPKDEFGQPIDPILKDGFDKSNQVRIIYTTYTGSGAMSKTISRVQCFDITTLWEAINHGIKGLPINPITNTHFTEEQFTTIVKKALEMGLVDGSSPEAVVKKYGYGHHTPHTDLTSDYEPKKIQLQSVLNMRQNHLLAYFSLIGDMSMVEKILYQNMDNPSFDVNFHRTSGTPLPNIKKITKPQTNILTKLSILSASNATNCSSSTTPTSPVEGENAEEINPLTSLDFEIDNDLEKSLLKYFDTYNAVQACCISGNKEILILLLQFGGDTSIEDEVTRATPLHIALLEKHIELVKVLMLYGSADQIEAESTLGSPLEIADMLISEIPDIYNVLFP